MPQRTSPWLVTVPDERRYPTLQSKIKADVVVVGAGLAGIMTAWQLMKQGKKVVVLEQNHVATGDTGFTTAFLTRVPDTSCAALTKRYGEDFVRKIFTATGQAQRSIIDLIKTEQIDCDLVECDSYNCAYTAGDAFLKDEWTAVQSADPKAELVQDETVAGLQPKIAQAIVYHGEASYHVRKFIFGLLQRPAAKAIEIFEESEVTGVEVLSDRVVVRTATGVVVGNDLAVTSGLPPAAFSELQPLFTPVITYALTARFADRLPLSSQLFWDTDEPYQYYRRLDDHTMMLGGADGSAASQAHATLEQFLQRRFPGKYTIDLIWSGSLFETEDGLPYISAHPQYPGKVYVACGFGGNGMVSSVMAGQLLADLITGQTNSAQPLFDFKRTGVQISKPTVVAAPKTSTTPWWVWFWRVVLPLGVLTALVLPGYIFFSSRGGLAFLEGLDAKTSSLVLFPLVGLYAFTLVWLQLILGSAMNLWRRVYPWIEKYHRAEGVFALLFAFLHPALILYGFGPEVYFARQFVTPELLLYVYLGYLQLILMVCTVGTALLMRLKFVKKWWRYIHFANYAVFISAWIHSWFLGSDVRFTNLRYFWITLAVTAAVSTAWRIIGSRRQAVGAAVPEQRTGEYVTVAKQTELKEGTAKVVEVQGKKIALCLVAGQVYAINNVCGHAGGPLSEGPLTGKVIECPWHGSQFDVTTGAIVTGPASRPQVTYPVRLTGDSITVQL